MATINHSSDPHRVFDSRGIPADYPLGSASRGAVGTAGRGITPLQSRAWVMANMSYQVPDGSAYRAYAEELYRQDVHERLLALFAALDAQNAALDAVLVTP